MMDEKPSSSSSSSPSSSSSTATSQGSASEDSRYQRIKQLFMLAAQLPAGRQQREFLQQLPDDQAVVDEVRSMLEADASAEHAEELLWISEPESRDDKAGETSNEEHDDLKPGEYVGSYQIVRLIGRGGMGVVYEAIQANPRRRVALKLLRNELKSDQAIQRFLHEAELLGRLRHPGMAQIYEAGVHEIESSDGGANAAKTNRPYFALELSHGQPVTSYAMVHRIGTHDTAYLAWRLCDAVAYAHRKGVIHLDLKPGNILVDPFGHPKILDFGLARALDQGNRDDANTSAINRSWMPCGTIPYMSPEQARGDVSAIDGQSDVFSLGVILHELLAGEPPIDPDSSLPMPDAFRMIQEMKPLPKGVLHDVCEPDLEAIVRKAVHPDKAQRYPSAQSMAEDLDRYLNDEPVEAMGQNPSYRFSQFTKRNRKVVPLTISTVVLAISTIILGWLAYWQHVQLSEVSKQSTPVQSQEGN